MAIAPLPTTLEKLGNRPFCFYPPIIGVERNEWLFRDASWSEMHILNAHDGCELWIPRRFVGEVSRIEEPLLIVGLLKELEYRDNAVWPHRRRVIQMPIAVGAEHLSAPRAGPAVVVQISLDPPAETRKARSLVGALVIGVLGVLVVAGVVGQSQSRPRRLALRDVSYRDLRAGDGVDIVERILGPSAAREWHPASGQLRMAYPKRGYTVVLSGPSAGEARYSGVVPLSSAAAIK